MSRLGVAVVGLGVGAAHARTYAALEECDLRLLYDLDGARADALARELGAGVAASYDQILENDAVTVVSIASFDDAHYGQVLAALEAGKHVFVEKPLCRTVGELRRLKEAWSENQGLHLASNLVLRAAPLYRWMRKRRRAGDLGSVFAFDGDYLYGRVHKITEGWRRDVPDYSVILGGGVHLVDLMLWITDERPETVTAAGNRIATEGTAFRYLDFVAATFAFPSGLVGRITANFGCVHPHQHVVRVFGTEATVIHDDCGSRVLTSRDPEAPPQSLEFASLPGCKGELVPFFVSGILDATAGPADTQHEFDVISVCAAADRAVAEGGVVEIDYV